MKTSIAFIFFFCISSVAFAQSKTVKATNKVLLESVQEDLPKKDFEWKHIVIHHTASEWSSWKRIDRYHREKFNDPDGIEYHFLIGNGKKSGKGEIELGRWKIQKRAIHLFKPEGAPDAIAISLIGNMHERKIFKAQYNALLNLVFTLMKTENISVENITTHTKVDGNLTVCPGKHFPYQRLMRDLKKKISTEKKTNIKRFRLHRIGHSTLATKYPSTICYFS